MIVHPLRLGDRRRACALLACEDDDRPTFRDESLPPLVRATNPTSGATKTPAYSEAHKQEEAP